MSRKRLFLAAGVLASVGAVVALAVGVTFGLFSATTTSGPDSFSAGTVTLDSPMTDTCGVSNKVPGDSGTCTITYNYTGSVPANIAVDVSVAGTAGTPVQTYGGSTPSAAAGLFDPATANGMIISLDDTTPTTYDLTGLTTATSSTSNLLIAKAVSSGSHTLTFHWSLPLAMGNAFQAAASDFTFTVHAVQSGNNASSGTLGQVDGSITWS